MKLLYLCPEYPPAPCGGIGRFYHALAHRLAANGADVSVIAKQPAGRTAARSVENGVKVWRLGDRGRDWAGVRGRLALRLAAADEIRRLRPDVVETYDWSGPAPWKPAAPLLVRMHGASTARAGYLGRRPSRLLRWCESGTLAAADSLAAVSTWIGRRTTDVFGLRGGFEPMPNGVDCRRFSPGPGEEQQPELLYVGSVREDKGVGLLLDAFALLGRERPELELRLCGPLPPAGLGADFLARRLDALEPSLRRRVRFEGRVPQSRLPQLYRRAVVCVLPSGGEAHPLACLEAMGCGAAVVANADGGMAETVEHDASGLLVGSAEPRVWAGAIGTLLDDPERRRRLGAAARRRVEARFCLEAAVRRNWALYERVAGGGGRR